MGKSYRKPYASVPKKKDKVMMHKKERAMVKSAMSTDNYDEIVLPEKVCQVTDIWSFNQDGNSKYTPNNAKLKRK
jgi:hypothetical protein